ncbi:MAG: aspartate aminotransferase family protein [Actinobacteria bacterium]|nr:MAG: aspartate aminotransferase family protein [Actinomycetota bacterium]
MSVDTETQRFTARAREIAARETKRLLDRTLASAKLYERAVRVLPKGVASNFQANDPYPIYLDHGGGSHVWDVDGTEYRDYHGGFGVNVVGHAHPKIVEAIERAARSGVHFAVTTEDTVALAEELCRRFRLDRVRIVNSGTEATMDAIRVARAATGREVILKIEGSYHGHHDAVLFSVLPEADLLGLRGTTSGEAADSAGDVYRTIPTSKGVPKVMADYTLIVPFNDAAALDHILSERGGQIAALIMEPIMMNLGIVLPQPGYLEAVRDLCSKHGVALIFDEVKSGATVAAGGAIERFGVQPDLACFAKAIGGGTTIGAFGGRADVMDWVTKGAAQQGTFNGNPLSAKAGLVALTEVLTPDAYEHLAKLGTLLAEGCTRAIQEYGIPAHAVDLGAKGCVSYRREPLRNYRDFLECNPDLFAASWPWLLNRGIFMTPGDEEQWSISVQHSEEDIGIYVEAFADFCAELAS